jgi:hypothetical protein
MILLFNASSWDIDREIMCKVKRACDRHDTSKSLMLKTKAEVSMSMHQHILGGTWPQISPVWTQKALAQILIKI